jgi:hypothetical protein
MGLKFHASMDSNLQMLEPRPKGLCPMLPPKSSVWPDVHVEEFSFVSLCRASFRWVELHFVGVFSFMSLCVQLHVDFGQA